MRLHSDIDPHAPRRRRGLLAWAVAALASVSACDDDVTDTATRPAADAATADAPVVDAAVDAPYDPTDSRGLVLRRLGRADYLHTVRDLVGDYAVAARDLPSDQIGYLFFNIGRTQTLARFDLERYLQVAEGVIDRAWARRAVADPEFQPNIEGAPMVTQPGFFGSAVRLDGSVEASFHLRPTEPGAATIQLRVQPMAMPAGPLVVEVVQDDFVLASSDVTALYPAGGEVTLYAAVQWRITPMPEPGPRIRLRVRGATAAAPVVLGSVRVTSPSRLPEQRLATCDPAAMGADACLRAIVGPFARRAWRRPLVAGELDRLVALGQSRIAMGDAFDVAARTALTAVLVSPRFLFRVEATSGATATPRDPYELATALSYFLWASTPDEALLAAAESGAITRTDEIERQVRRMVADPRFDGFVHSFAGQWLSFNGAAPEPVSNMLINQPRPEIESALFFGRLFRDNAPLSAVFEADWTYLDEQVRHYYDFTGPLPTDGFVRASLTGLPRMGFLTQSSFLTVTSTMSQTTEPTVRGYFILSRLLCDAPDPPTRTFDNFVMEFDQGNNGAADHTFRQVLEAHRANPECAGCHAIMDPVGFAFENYDVRGVWRTQSMGHTLDAAATAEGIGSFRNALELIPMLERDARTSPCVVRHLMTYALGHGDLDPVADSVNDVVSQFNAHNRQLLDLLVAVATSPAFRTRSPQGAP